jgi:hypothetical protein
MFSDNFVALISAVTASTFLPLLLFSRFQSWFEGFLVYVGIDGSEVFCQIVDRESIQYQKSQCRSKYTKAQGANQYIIWCRIDE